MAIPLARVVNPVELPDACRRCWWGGSAGRSAGNNAKIPRRRARLDVITLECCGEKHHADEQYIGRRIKCRKCGRVLIIQGIEPVRSATSAKPVASTPWPVVAPNKTRPMPMIRVAVGGGVLTSLIAWLVVSGLTDRKAKSDANNSGPPAVEPLPTTSKSERQVSPKRPAAFLPTGTWVLQPRGTRGHGILRIQNGSDLDSALKLVSVDVPRKVFWIATT
jgi:hypothetical protein